MRTMYVAVFALLISFFQGASAQVFAGYDAFCGLPVVVGPDPQTASARTNSAGYKFIHIDPAAMNNWTASRMFVLAHECAHHLLGHTSELGSLQRYYGGTAQQELAADCWAAQRLAEVGQRWEISRSVLDSAAQGHFTGGGYPSGMARASNILSCVGAGSPGPTSMSACSTVQVAEPYVQIEMVPQQVSGPCQHCGCNPWGQCGCLHPADVVTNMQPVSVTRTRLVNKQVCR